ncbi:MAG: hypothetical protein ACOYCD_08830 [Kiritimatiellia bacterium]
MKLRSIIGLLMLAAATWASGQTTIYVATTGSDLTGDGTAGNPFLTISNAVAQAEAADVVLVNPGVYTQDVQIHVNKNITVRGMHGPTGVVITTRYPDVNCSTRCVRVNSAGAVLDGVTLERGYPPNNYANQNAHGGGILVEAGLVTNCIIRENQSRWGGDAALWTENACMRNCWISNNVSAYGPSPRGGGVILGDSNKEKGGARLLDCIINSNAAWISGGGIYVSAAGGIISNCTVADNYLSYIDGAYGGGIATVKPGLLIIDSVVSNNFSALYGAGIGVVESGYPVIRNTEVVENKARFTGSGIQVHTYADGGALISNCVIKGNQTSVYGGRGGGICDGYPGGDGKASLGALSVVDTKIVDNGSVNLRFGGGVFIYTHGTAMLHNCEIISNSLADGSGLGVGIYAATGSTFVIIKNCLIADNISAAANTWGGGIFFSGYTCAKSGLHPLQATVESCTIVGNSVTREYGGMNIITNHVTVINCVVASNSAGSAYPDMQGGAEYIAPVHYSCSPALINSENGNTTNAPVFVNFDAGDYRLVQGSPCINTGTNLPWMAEAVDLNGHIRIDRFSRVVDMGCYEYLPQGMILNLR